MLRNLGNPDYILSLLLSLPAIVIAITFHEFAHAWVADKLGDDTPRCQGRLSLAPDKHIDPIGFILLLFAGFGWGKPVQINPRNFDRKISMTKGEALVSIAGPLMNFILAILTLIIINVVNLTGVLEAVPIKYSLIIAEILLSIFTINVSLGVFNLIPLPPLDGSKILMHFLPYNARSWFIQNEHIFYYAFLIIWITGISSVIITPAINGVAKGMIYVVNSIFSLFA